MFKLGDDVSNDTDNTVIFIKMYFHGLYFISLMTD